MLRKISFNIAFITGLLLISACSYANGDSDSKIQKLSQEELNKFSRAYFASGCFWCVESIFESVEGVHEAISGYTGGEIKNPTYRQVSAGRTKHAEAVEVYYDSSVVDYKTLLVVFFGSHDPTTLNRQGPDAGPHYRSAIFYQTEDEKRLAEAYIKELNGPALYNGRIVTELTALNVFYIAEEYHQDYERKNPYNPYVQAVSIPRLKDFQERYPELLKKEAMSSHE